MTDGDAIRFFQSETASHARMLPLSDATTFLRGALAVAGDRAEFEALRSAYQMLVAGEGQLELIVLPKPEAGR